MKAFWATLYTDNISRVANEIVVSLWIAFHKPEWSCWISEELKSCKMRHAVFCSCNLPFIQLTCVQQFALTITVQDVNSGSISTSYKWSWCCYIARNNKALCPFQEFIVRNIDSKNLNVAVISTQVQCHICIKCQWGGHQKEVIFLCKEKGATVKKKK